MHFVYVHRGSRFLLAGFRVIVHPRDRAAELSVLFFIDPERSIDLGLESLVDHENIDAGNSDDRDQNKKYFSEISAHFHILIILHIYHKKLVLKTCGQQAKSLLTGFSVRVIVKPTSNIC